jgi:predicted DNA-binding ribbon-helix-helix protein
MDPFPTTPIERPLYIGGSAVTLTMEFAHWDALDEISVREKMTIERIVSTLTDCWDLEEVTSLLRQLTVTYFKDATPSWRPDRSEHDGGALLRKVLGDISTAS